MLLALWCCSTVWAWSFVELSNPRWKLCFLRLLPCSYILILVDNASWRVLNHLVLHHTLIYRVVTAVINICTPINSYFTILWRRVLTYTFFLVHCFEGLIIVDTWTTETKMRFTKLQFCIQSLLSFLSFRNLFIEDLIMSGFSYKISLTAQ
jgi:hypothetical protein